jgi:hypothetical protein
MCEIFLFMKKIDLIKIVQIFLSFYKYTLKIDSEYLQESYPTIFWKPNVISICSA